MKPDRPEQYRYLMEEKSQDNKFPDDVKFNPDTDIKIQYNDYVSPTTTKTEKIEPKYSETNKSYSDLDNEQIDMAHPNKSAFYKINSISDLLRKNAEEKEEFYKKIVDNWEGMGKNLTKDDVDPQELEMGIKVELEHTNSREIATRIALDHIYENEHYYSDGKAGQLLLEELI